MHKIHDDVRREESPVLPRKQPFLSFSPYFSPYGKRSAIQKRLLAYFSEPESCRIQPNRAHYGVFKNVCAGIWWIWAEIGTPTITMRVCLRRRGELSRVQVSHCPKPEWPILKKGVLSLEPTLQPVPQSGHEIINPNSSKQAGFSLHKTTFFPIRGWNRFFLKNISKTPLNRPVGSLAKEVIRGCYQPGWGVRWVQPSDSVELRYGFWYH